MFETISRGWEITKLSFGVIRQDKEMLAFPALGGFFSLLYGFLIMWPTVIAHLLNPTDDSFAWGLAQNIAAFATYFGLAFIATFFNTCTVYTAKTRFAGGDATFMDSIRFALSKIHLIFAWSLVAASVGMIFRLLDSMAQRAGGMGRIIFSIINSILGMMWNVLTLFVVPVMVYEEVGPLDAIQRSGEVLKKTWGESLVRHFGFGIIQFFAMLPGLALLLVGFSGMWPLIILGVVWVLLVALSFSVATMVFNAALYEFAATGKIPSGFNQNTMRAAFVTKR